MGRLDDPELVRQEYSSESGLAGRSAAYRFAEGPDPRELAVDAVTEVSPRRFLEVGCGWGWFSERVASETGAEVIALDLSERMVDLARERGVDARVGDVQALPFPDDSFDCAAANWMLYHVPDVDRAVAELSRVLRPGGRLVAVTNSREHLAQLVELLGVEREEPVFSAENGERRLRPHFAEIESRDAAGWIVFPDRRAAQEYVDASAVLSTGGRQLPEFDGPLRVRRAPVVFVAETAR